MSVNFWTWWVPLLGAAKNRALTDPVIMYLVETMGFEPTTSGLQSPRSPS